MSVHQTLLFFAPIFAVLIAMEYAWGRRQGLALYSWDHSLASIAIGVGQQVLGLLSLGVIAGWLMTQAWSLRLFEFSISDWWYVPVLFIAHEFFYYWFHRFSHTIRWLWATHCVHHSTEQMNILAAYRFGWTGWLSSGKLVFVPLVWFGFHPAAVASAMALNLMYQSWLHTMAVGKLGPLEGILNTPSAHRVHHARNVAYLDRNYGGVLIVFDRLFGTYCEEREEERCEFGLLSPPKSFNPIRIALHDWIALGRSLRTHAPRHWPGFLFGPPGWAPDGRGTTSKDLKAALAASRTPSHKTIPTPSLSDPEITPAPVPHLSSTI